MAARYVFIISVLLILGRVPGFVVISVHLDSDSSEVAVARELVQRLQSQPEACLQPNFTKT